MKSRILIKEIPGGKFHSAIFTSYSFNFYYLEQQVIPMLNSKGIRYVNILADSKILDSQLESFGQHSESNKRSYSLYGVHSQNSFHPKIIYLVGDKNILILVGSGNLTTSGHGKNLETFSPVWINIEDNSNKSFANYIWDYIRTLFGNLGVNAQQKLRNIVENSPILSDILNTEPTSNYSLPNGDKLHFLYPKQKESIYKQIKSIVTNKGIDRIVFMTPFYDENGKLIQQFNNNYNPNEIDIVLQNNFGKKPSNLEPEPKMKFFDWSKIKNGSIKQPFFHAKNIVLVGKNKQYLITGSANASIAAFGNDTLAKLNDEACFLFESETEKYLDLLDMDFSKTQIQLGDITEEHINNKVADKPVLKINIISLEKMENHLRVLYRSDSDYKKVQLLLHSSSEIRYSLKVGEINSGTNELKLIVDQNNPPFYGHFTIDGKKISNNQFVIDLHITEGANPSKQNRDLLKIKSKLESNFLSSSRIIDYLNSIAKFKQKKPSNDSASVLKENERDNLQGNEYIHLSYEKMQSIIKDFSNTFDGKKSYINHHNISIWESLSAYLKTSKEKREQDKYDHEETENVEKSSGSHLADKDNKIDTNSITKFVGNQRKIIGYFNKYIEILRSKISEPHITKPQLYDLSVYLIQIELMIRLVEFKEMVMFEDGHEETIHVLKQKFSHKGLSLSQFIIETIGLFTLWLNKAEGYEQFDNHDYRVRLKQYNNDAFKSSLALLSLFNSINDGHKENVLEYWQQINILNVDLSFNTQNNRYETPEPFDDYINSYTLNSLGEETIHEEIMTSLSFLNNNTDSVNPKGNGFYKHPEDGYCFIEYLTKNENNGVFLKLFNTGYEWNSKLNNYWNQKLYGLKNLKWYSTK